MVVVAAAAAAFWLVPIEIEQAAVNDMRFVEADYSRKR